jgi:hypothetical protein
MKAFALQTAVYTKLSANSAFMTALSNRLYSDVPQAGDAALGFPMCVIGPDVISPWDTKGGLGGSAIVQADVYSRAGGWGQCKGLADTVYGLLHRQPLTIAGASWVDTNMETATFNMEADGETRRGLMLFRVTYDAIV